jgi:hypothetical protein
VGGTREGERWVLLLMVRKLPFHGSNKGSSPLAPLFDGVVFPVWDLCKVVGFSACLF